MLYPSPIPSILRHAWAQLTAWHSKITQPAPPIFLVVEGLRDVGFLKWMSTILHSSDPAIPDLANMEANGRIACIPFGGGDIRPWAFRLAGLNGREVHIYDRETSPMTEVREHIARIVNLRPGCRAFVMQRRAIENYLHTDAIFEACGVRITFSEQDDVSFILAQAMYAMQHPGDTWESLPTSSRRRRLYRTKHLLNTDVVKRMTLQRLAQSDPDNEIRTWITTIGRLATGPC